MASGLVNPDERKFEMNAIALTGKLQHALKFESHEVKLIHRLGQIWMSSTELGKALEYANPETAVTKLYASRSDEFTDTMTKVFKIATAGGKQAIRFFSLRGAHLLAMFARTDKAKAFRVWVLNVLDAEVAKPVKAQAKSYHFPLQSCKPVAQCEGFDHQAQFDARTLADPRNPAPELDLIKQLERDGHDVAGARVRILAMRHQLKHLLMSRQRMASWEDRLLKVVDEVRNYQREQGLSALFTGRVGAGDLGFEAQLPDWSSKLQPAVGYGNGAA